ncbi:MAG: HAMP domain-containing sensor histidine kinase [Chloroflexota bacterium]
MRSLTLKLTLIILVASLVGVGLVAMLTQRSVTRRFNELVTSEERAIFTDWATEYYGQFGTWKGFLGSLPAAPLGPDGLPNALEPNPPRNNLQRTNPLLNNPSEAAVDLMAAKSESNTDSTQENTGRQNSSDRNSNGPNRNNPNRNRPNRPRPRPGPPPFVLLDVGGCIITPGGRYNEGDCLSPREVDRGNPIVLNDQFVGTVLTINDVPVLNGLEETYLRANRQAVWTGAMGGAAIALLLGLLLAQMVTRPLKELTEAIRNMTGGELKQEVRVRSQDELGELSAAFNKMSSDLARANHLRRQMTADIAHELRNPLMVLLGYLESMRDGVLKPTEQRLETMYSEAQHLQKLIQDLRTLSLADAGELALNRSEVSPSDILERTQTVYERQAIEQEVELRCALAPGLPTIHADEERINQVLGNLVSNALRYTPARGAITLSAHSTDGCVQLSVQDTGIGIRQEEQERIFERFYQTDPSRSGESGESGLGLAIAKSIMELHGGSIEVESTPGEGAKFTLTFEKLSEK